MCLSVTKCLPSYKNWNFKNLYEDIWETHCHHVSNPTALVCRTTDIEDAAHITHDTKLLDAYKRFEDEKKRDNSFSSFITACQLLNNLPQHT